MSNLAVAYNKKNYDNIISFDSLRNVKIDDDAGKKESPLAGKSSEVYAFRTVEEIAAMINVLDKHIDEAENDDQRRIAWRNKMLFVIGINVGIRASDLRTLRWSFFFKEDGAMKDSYKIQPMKTRKQKKFVTLYFNDAVKTIISNYVEQYPYGKLDDYLFASRVGDEPITVRSLWRIIKQTALEAGIDQNIGSHSLRKTWGRFCFEQAEDKTRALVVLQKAFNHSDSLTTLKYVGLLDDEIAEMYNSINLGLDMI